MLRPLTIALVQFKPSKGKYDANVARAGELLAECAAFDPRPDVVQFPETALTGYFVEGGVRDVAVTAGTFAADLDRAYRAACARLGRNAVAIDVVVGFYEVWRNTLYNSAAYLSLGDGAGAGAAEQAPAEPRVDVPPTIRHVHRKHFLPTYGLFDEERFVERGFDVRAFDAPWGRTAILVCEDAWHSLTGTIAALDGAQLIFVSAAAPARGVWPRDDGVPGPASVARWERLVRDIAEEHGVFVAYTNLVGSEGGKSFGGSSTLVGPNGDVRVRAPVWDEAIVTITVDLNDLTRARGDSPLLNDLRSAMPHLLSALGAIDAPARPTVAYDASTRGQAPVPSPTRAASSAGSATGIAVIRAPRDGHGLPASLEIDGAMVEGWLVTFLRDEFSRRGFSKAVLGLSGGVDSAVTAYLAARALGAENVIGIRMPYRSSSADSLAHAQLVVDALGIETRTVEITNAVDGYLALEPDADGARRGNVMARMRMIVLFDLSSRYRALPVGTGNKTERLFGYFTWHADDSPPVNPLGDLYKTQVWALARHLGVPGAIIDKPASADLVAGQTDEGDFGITYARADRILNWLLSGYSAEDLMGRGFEAAEVELVRRRLGSTHWKRRLPAVAMVSPTAIGEAYLRPVDY